MRGAERDVGEERSVRTHPLAVADHPEELVDEIFADVVAVLGPGGCVDRVVVGDELGVELIGLALEEAVEAVEPATERPLVERARSGALVHRGEVPLAGAERGVALGPEDLGHGRCVVGDVAELVREPGLEVRHRAHADGVL